MKHTHTSTIALTVLAGISLVTPAFAVVNMNWTSIGNAGNAADPSTGYGSVDHTYNIGTYEVTNAQYVDFLNAKGTFNTNGIYNEIMGTGGIYGSNIFQYGSSGNYQYSVVSTYANMPVVGVTWFDAARFSNWLGNGQGNGDMETGAYTLNNAMSGVILANSGASVYIPSENEWYKAAYYNGANSTYSLYPNGQNTITTSDANYGPSSGVVDIGYGKASSSGTFGQGGNAWEWNDAIISGSLRGLSGGSWSTNVDYLASSYRGHLGPSDKVTFVGFRVASVPEPTSVFLAIFGSGIWVMRRKR